MSKQIFRSVAHEQIHNREVQRYKFHYIYTISANIAAAATTPFVLTIDQDADYMMEKWTGSAAGPVNANGIPQVANTDFPQPGIGAGAGFAGRGLTVRLTDTGAGRDLSNGFVPVENILSPGYGVQLFLPYPVRYFAKRNSKIKFDFRNRDTQGRHSIDIAIGGYKYQMPEMLNTLEVDKEFLSQSQVAA